MDSCFFYHFLHDQLVIKVCYGIIFSQQKRSIGPAEKIEKVCQEAVEVKKKKATTPAKEQTNVPKESSWAARLASFNPSPPAIERMRGKANPRQTQPTYTNQGPVETGFHLCILSI